MSQLDDKESVLSVNKQFYSAFAVGDYEALVELWSNQHDVAVIHPGWPALHGYDAVMHSWKQITQGQGQTDINCIDEQVYLMPSSAFVICTEVLGESRLIATNIFVKENEEWKMVHHQAAPMPAIEKQTDVVVH